MRRRRHTLSTKKRASELRRLLHERRREAQNDIGHRVRDSRSDQSTGVRDHLEHSDVSTREDIEIALIQMKVDTLRRIDQALARLDAGQYGSCIECAHEIAERRLRALPFAVRCQACEERREQEHGRARRLAQRDWSQSLFSDASGP